MSSNNPNQTAGVTPSLAASTDASKGADSVGDALARAALTAGTPGFATDMAKLEEALAAHREKFHQRPLLETAKQAAVYGGITGLCLIATFVILRLIAGGSSETTSQ